VVTPKEKNNKAWCARSVLGISADMQGNVSYVGRLVTKRNTARNGSKGDGRTAQPEVVEPHPKDE